MFLNKLGGVGGGCKDLDVTSLWSRWRRSYTLIKKLKYKQKKNCIQTVFHYSYLKQFTVSTMLWRLLLHRGICASHQATSFDNWDLGVMYSREMCHTTMTFHGLKRILHFWIESLRSLRSCHMLLFLYFELKKQKIR